MKGSKLEARLGSREGDAAVASESADHLRRAAAMICVLIWPLI
jgi:hypothetical protein